LLKAVVDAGVPALVFFSMVAVGMELTPDDFRRVACQPGMVVAVTLGQFVWLLVAACPGGAMANVCTYLSRANVVLAPVPILLAAILVFR
jgi:BASS family bile acid:Na+ symporter